MHTGDFPGSPVIKNPASTARDKGLIPDQGTKIPHTLEHLSLCTTTREWPHSLQLEIARSQQQRPSTAENTFKKKLLASCLLFCPR